ncbi:hypothetical protein [uncultured Tateyamaria sp.]
MRTTGAAVHMPPPAPAQTSSPGRAD